MLYPSNNQTPGESRADVIGWLFCLGERGLLLHCLSHSTWISFRWAGQCPLTRAFAHLMETYRGTGQRVLGLLRIHYPIIDDSLENFQRYAAIAQHQVVKLLDVEIIPKCLLGSFT